MSTLRQNRSELNGKWRRSKLRKNGEQQIELGKLLSSFLRWLKFDTFSIEIYRENVYFCHRLLFYPKFVELRQYKNDKKINIENQNHIVCCVACSN